MVGVGLRRLDKGCRRAAGPHEGGRGTGGAVGRAGPAGAPVRGLGVQLRGLRGRERVGRTVAVPPESRPKGLA